MHNFRKLMIWKEAMTLAVEIYNLTKKLPSEEKFGLTSQMRRAAVSIPSNIAEGSGRGTNKDFAQFLNISAGSCFELETQLLLTFKVEHLHEDEVTPCINNLQRLQKKIYSFKEALLKR